MVSILLGCLAVTASHTPPAIAESSADNRVAKEIALIDDLLKDLRSTGENRRDAAVATIESFWKDGNAKSVDLDANTGLMVSRKYIRRIALAELLTLLRDERQPTKLRATVMSICISVASPHELLGVLIALTRDKDPLIKSASIAAIGVAFQSIGKETKDVRRACISLQSILTNQKETVTDRKAAAGSLMMTDVAKAETSARLMRIIQDKTDNVEIRAQFAGFVFFTTTPSTKNSTISTLVAIFCDPNESLAIRVSCSMTITLLAGPKTSVTTKDVNAVLAVSVNQNEPRTIREQAASLVNQLKALPRARFGDL